MLETAASPGTQNSAPTLSSAQDAIRRTVAVGHSSVIAQLVRAALVEPRHHYVSSCGFRVANCLLNPGDQLHNCRLVGTTSG